MSSAAQGAEDHLRRIRAENGLDGTQVPKTLVKNLEAAVKVLSDQLYQKSTHFLLELIQNADDNDYEVDNPTLHITYAQSHVRIDSNEVGFSPRHVDAICSIGQSSKAGAGVSTQYVGEKGIGFKSVFKVADVVWVSSRAYSFKFDKNAPLGMIAPIPDDFPAAKRSGWTSFYLQLSKEYDTSELVAELMCLDPRLLIFLRRLKTICVTIAEMRDDKEHIAFHTTFSREDGSLGSDEIIVVQQDDARGTYAVRRHTVEDMPFDEKREGISKSQILLAFPLDDKNQPRCEPQYVYAFLPIRQYGFEFLLQGDFLLIASREDVNNSSAWNKKLRDSFADAFLKSAKHFNTGPLRYVWPRFVPEISSVSDFFSPLKEAVINKLSDEPVLESWGGAEVRPTELVYIPEEFRDESGIPLTLIPAQKAVYASKEYSHDDSDHLERMGIVMMGFPEFIRDLKVMVASELEDFLKKPAEWHSRLAVVLNQTPKELKPELLKLPLIQLRTGEWVPAAKDKIFFSVNSANWEVPGGLDLMVVHPDVVSDLPRNHLYRSLGVKYLNPIAVIDVILQLHSNSGSDPASIARVDLISQMVFLYRNQWRNRRGVRFWFATEHEQRKPSAGLYHDCDCPHAARKFFTSSRDKIHFIHADYLTANPNDSETWLKWLRENMGISHLPKLVSITSSDDQGKATSFNLSQDFEFLMKSAPSEEVLQLLCDNWLEYLEWIEPPIFTTMGTEFAASQKRLKAKISAMIVKAKTNQACRLDETFIPLEELVTAAKGSVPFLDLPEPSHPRWQKLSHFGVGVKQDVKFYLRCLDKISNSDKHTSQAGFFLEQIQARCNDDEELVRKYFNGRGKRLVFVPHSDAADGEGEPRGIWYGLHQCLWDGPKCLRLHVCLKELYPGIRRLFTDILGITDASMRVLMLEASCFKMRDDLGYIRDILLELDKFLEKDRTYTSQVGPLKSKKIWPVVQSEVHGEFGHLMTATEDEWFIPDREPLKECFSNIVPLFALQPNDIDKMERLLKGLELDGRLLSRAAMSVPRTSGTVSYHAGHTEDFRSRYEFMARLVPISAIDRKKTRDTLIKLRNLEVHVAEDVVQRYFVTYKGNQIEGRQRRGNVVLTPEDDGLKIYLRQGYLETERNWDELVEKLASFAGIDSRNNGCYLLQIVLTESRSRTAAKLLEFGVSTEVPDPEMMEEDESWLHSRREAMDMSRLRRRLAEMEGQASMSTEGISVLSSANMPNGQAWDDDEGDDDALTNGEAPSNEFKIVAMPRTNRFGRGGMGGDGDGLNDELDFVGQNEVSKLLQRKMGDKYKPAEHWTSRLRTKAGHPPLQAPASKAAFTIPDPDGIMISIMKTGGFVDAAAWKSRPPVWHLEVKTTVGGRDDEFPISGAEFERVRRYSLQTQERLSSIPSDVVILVRVYNAKELPEVSLYVDPWSLFLSNAFRLQPSGTLFGRMSA